MSSPLRYSSPAATIASWVALGSLALGVVVAGAVVVETAGTLADDHPEFAHLLPALLAAAIAFSLCLEVVLLITALLIGAIHRGSIFDRAALRLVDALIVVLVVATVVVVAVLPVLPGPPALGLAVLGAAITGATFVLVVIVLRSLLRQAAAMRLELDEVV